MEFWDVDSGKRLATLSGHTKAIRFVAFSPDGLRLVSASDDGMAKLWDVATGTIVGPLIGHDGAVFAASFSPDGKRVVTASWDGTARLWDAATCSSLAVFADHRGKVWDAEFSRDGNQIVTAGEDGVAYIYSTKLDFYVKRACELLRGHREEFQEVADVCKTVGVMPLPPEPVSGVAKQ